MWLALLNALVQLALLALRQVERKQALDQARLEAINELLRKSDALIRDVDSIVDSVSHSPDDILRDPANRDSKSRDGGSGEKGGVQDGVRGELQRNAGHPADDSGNKSA